jgi:hypothetical protein
VPRITIRTPQAADYLLPGSSYEDIGRAGQILAGGLERAQERRAANKRAQLQHQEDMRRLDIEEQRAQASLAKEANALAAKQAAADERDADRQAVTQGLAEMGSKAVGRAQQDQVKRALASPGGLLGPFGMATALAKGTPETLAVQQRMAGKMELAKRMSPAAGRAFLARETAAEKQTVLTQGYQEEMQALDNAVREGKFDDPFGPDSTGGEQSDQGAAKAKELAKKLQEGLAAGQPPGLVHKEIQNAYDLHAKLSARKAGWEAADLKVKEMLDQMRVLANNAPAGVDPDTGKSIRGELIERAHAVEGEWQRTIGLPGVSESYRRATDPDKDVGELTKLLFGAQTEASPDAVLAEMNAAAAAKGPAQQEQDMALATGAGSARKPTRTAQAAPGAKGAAGGSVPRGTPSRAPQGDKQAGQIRSIVQAELSKALQFGAKVDRTASIKGLLDRLEHDLGLDMADQKVREQVREAMSQAVGSK